MCLKEICACKWKITFKCDGQWKLNHPIEEVKKSTCYKCLLLERPRRKVKKTNIFAWFDAFIEKHKFDLREKCDFCGSFGLMDKIWKDDFINEDKDSLIMRVQYILSVSAGDKKKAWFLFCKDSSCSKMFKKRLLTNAIVHCFDAAIINCLITPYLFKNKT
jgi:hypothetical protein